MGKRKRSLINIILQKKKISSSLFFRALNRLQVPKSSTREGVTSDAWWARRVHFLYVQEV